MILQKYLKSEDYRTYLGMGQVALSIGTLEMLIGVSPLLNFVIKAETWLDFTKGLFVGMSSCLLVFALVLSILGMRYLIHTTREGNDG